MINTKVFNKEVANFLDKLGDNKKVSIFKSANIYHSDYSNFLDWFAYDLGIMFFNIEVVNKNLKTLGYFPELRIYDNNVFKEKCEDIRLSNEWIDLKKSSEILAKEVIKKIFSYDHLETFIKEKNYKN